MMKIEACAGAGKTSTLEMMAEANSGSVPVPRFNKVTANEGKERFPKHVTCKTTHSVAYSVMAPSWLVLASWSVPRGRGYVNVAGTGSEMARFFKINPLQQAGEIVLPAAFIGLLVKITVARFEQSADSQLPCPHAVRRTDGEVQDRHVRRSGCASASAVLRQEAVG
jgi:hypothetical protein